MKNRKLLVFLTALSLGLSLPAPAADDAAKPKPGGYTVVLEMKVDEKGEIEDARVVSSDDPSAERLLEKKSFQKARELKLIPRVKDGKAVKYTARAPFVFPVEGDEGPEDPAVTKPTIRTASQPVYPPEEAAKGEVGAVILEAMIGVDGKVSDLKTLRSSSPVFEKAVMDAVAQWIFVPAAQNGSPVASRWRMSICFETDVLAADWTWRIAPRPSLGNYTVVHRTKPEPAPAEPPVVPPAK